jgi:very-short-patch-repair endonuclease
MAAKPRITTDRAKSLRKNETFTEKKLWEILKNREYKNLKFRRQFPIHPFIADFYCHELKLIIELDGITHDTLKKKKYDKSRDLFLLEKGYHVIRVSDEDFIEKPSILFDALDGFIREVKDGRK